MTDCGEPLSQGHGYYHLTPRGWFRVDQVPFPSDRVETWYVETALPAEGAKERDRLTRIWVASDVPAETLEEIRARFGDAIVLRKDRVIQLQSKI